MITEDRACFNGVRTRRLSLSGNGTPIALLHGFADSADTWRGLMAEFEAAGRAAFAVDMPGFGHADPCSPGSIMPQLDAFVDAMLTDARGPVMLMGNSLGACVSVGAASRRSGNVRGVVAVNEPTLASHWLMRLGRGRVDPFRPLEFRLPIPKRLRHRMVRAICARALYPDPAQADPAVLQRIAVQASDLARIRQLLQNARAVALETATGYQAERITCPVLVIHGARDRVIPVHASERLHESVPASGLVVMPNSGHCPQLDDPAGLAAHVLRFVEPHIDV
jgi:pimeloyl-ACP methyl ester carboxylesterase